MYTIESKLKPENNLSKIKSRLHPKNKHNTRYDFSKLIESLPELSEYVSKNKYGNDSVDFFNPDAVLTLNKALLKHHYNINFWEIPKHYLCPPIPGRADYIHYIADLLAESFSEIPKGTNIRGLDIGVGANCIYPIIGHQEYGWSFIASDVSENAIKSAKQIVEQNRNLSSHIELKLQKQRKSFFKGILSEDIKIDFSICNPPFHASKEEAEKANLRKLKNLKGKTKGKTKLNFGGQQNELWTKGGEARFIKDMIFESRNFSKQCLWFTTLVSKEATLKTTYKILDNVEATAIKTIEMGQGQKTSRFIAWTFLTAQEQKEWKTKRW